MDTRDFCVRQLSGARLTPSPAGRETVLAVKGQWWDSRVMGRSMRFRMVSSLRMHATAVEGFDHGIVPGRYQGAQRRPVHPTHCNPIEHTQPRQLSWPLVSLPPDGLSLRHMIALRRQHVYHCRLAYYQPPCMPAAQGLHPRLPLETVCPRKVPHLPRVHQRQQGLTPPPPRAPAHPSLPAHPLRPQLSEPLSLPHRSAPGILTNPYT